MANNASARLPPSGNVVYDSRNDTLAGRKRAVITAGEVSVAERARLFGTQIRAVQPKTQQRQRPPINQSLKANVNHQDQNNQPLQSNVVHQDNNYRPFQSSAYRRPNADVSYSTSQRLPNNFRSPIQSNFRTKREQPPTTNFNNYSTATRPTTRQIPPAPNQNRNASTRYQTSTSYNSFQPITPKQAPRKTVLSHRSSDESYTTYDDDSHHELNTRQKPQQSHNTTGYKSPNYFRPIHDPLDLLFDNASQTYSQQPIPPPTTNEMDLNGLQPFNLENLISRIQQDYAQSAKPYVSSIQFVQNNRSLIDSGFITPASTRKIYTQPPQDLNRQQGAFEEYDDIDTNGFQRYDNRHPKQSHTDNRYSSMDRRKHKTRYHDQASSPIHMPVAPIPKPPPTPPPATHSSDEDEDTPPVSQSTPARAVVASASSASSEDESVAKPSITLSLSKTTVETASTPVPIETPTSQRSGITRSALPNQASSTIPQTPTKEVESETEESESETESESESEEEQPKPKPKPSPIVRTNNQLATPSTPNTRSANTPQLNTRGVIPQRNDTARSANTPQLNTRGVIPQRNDTARSANTPQLNTRGVIPQRNNTNDNHKNQIPEPSNSVHSIDPDEDYEKPSSFGGKLKSLRNKFRLKKS